MEYIKYLPSEPLKEFVECFYIWRSPSPGHPLWVDTPPTAYSAFVFNLKHTHAVLLEDGQIQDLPRSFISGQCIRNYSLKIDGPIDQVGIVFKPTGIYHLFGLTLFEFTNTRVDLHDVLKEDFSHIEDQLDTARSDAARIQLLEKLLLKKIRADLPVQDGVDLAARSIITLYGNVNIAGLLEDAYMSRRKFERHFFKRVGLSPKYYARIRRYGSLCSLIAGQRSVNWDRILYKVGYYDQSHFIKDFREFSGKSPGQYLLTNNELAHSVEVEKVKILGDDTFDNRWTIESII
jgi:AraC-like DNA-binding protein